MNSIRCTVVIVIVLTFLYCIIATGVFKKGEGIINKRNMQLQELLDKEN